MRIREIAAARVRYGYFRIYILLRREGWKVNHKRVYRIYRPEEVRIWIKRPRRYVRASYREGRVQPGCANDSWSMDFISDSPFDGRRLSALTVVDNFKRESLAIAVDQGIKGEHVAAVLERSVAEGGTPKSIRVDHGPEFVSKVLDRWAYERGVTLDFSRPGKPIDNAYVESFNGRLREECLNVNGFLSLEDAQAKIVSWRGEYNESWPQTALGYVPPAEFAAWDGASPVPGRFKKGGIRTP